MQAMANRTVAAGLMLCSVAASAASSIAITGATLVDVSHFGETTQDIDNAVVLIEGDHVVAAGAAANVAIPRGARRIDARGRYLVPGLIEGFGSIKTQGFANAWLYNGVTTVSINDGDTRRGALFQASPTPRVFHSALVNGYAADGKDNSDDPMQSHRLNDRRLTNEQLTQRIEAIGAAGTRTLLIHYDTWPDQVDWIVREAKRLGIGTFGELGWTSYAYGARAGINVFIHTSRYLSALAPPDMLLDYADDPFGKAARPATRYHASLPPDAPETVRYAQFLAKSKTVLMPNIVMTHQASVGAYDDIWRAPSAELIRPEELHRPLDRRTLQAAYAWPKDMKPEERQAIMQKVIATEAAGNAFNALAHKNGVHFIAASGSAAFGVLPGSGLVDEVIAMQRVVGMNPRQALATATSNYADTLGWKGIGRIEPGNHADVLVLDRDPRNDVAAIRSIAVLIANGMIVDRPALLQLKRTPQNSPASAVQTDQR